MKLVKNMRECRQGQDKGQEEVKVQEKKGDVIGDFVPGLLGDQVFDDEALRDCLGKGSNQESSAPEYYQCTGDKVVESATRKQVQHCDKKAVKKLKNLRQVAVCLLQAIMFVQVTYECLSLVGGFEGISGEDAEKMMWKNSVNEGDADDGMDSIFESFINLVGGTGWLFLLGGVGTGTGLHIDWSGALNIAFSVKEKGEGRKRKMEGETGKEQGGGDKKPLALWLFLTGSISAIEKWNHAVDGKLPGGQDCNLPEATRKKLKKIQHQKWELGKEMKKSE